MIISFFRKGNFEISIYNSIKTDIAEKWDAMNPESLHSSYLRFIEESRPLDLEFRYILVENKNNEKPETIAIIYLQVLKFTKKNIHLSNSFFLKAIASLTLAIRPFRILICGNLFAVNFPAIRYNQNEISKQSLLQILSEIEVTHKGDVFILKDLSDEFSPSEMMDYGWTSYPSDLTMALTVDRSWKNMEDYIKCLSRKYRKRAEKIIDAGKRMIRKEMNENDITTYSGDIKKLFDQVASKQTIRMGLIDKDYFYAFRKKFPDTFSFVGYFFEEKLIGFATYIEHGETLEMHYIGIDYSFNKEQNIYFNILFDGVERAIKRKKVSLELGRTAREAKANLGAKPVYFNDYVHIKGRFARIIVNRFASFFQEDMGEKWKERHPFI